MDVLTELSLTTVPSYDRQRNYSRPSGSSIGPHQYERRTVTPWSVPTEHSRLWFIIDDGMNTCSRYSTRIIRPATKPPDTRPHTWIAAASWLSRTRKTDAIHSPPHHIVQRRLEDAFEVVRIGMARTFQKQEAHYNLCRRDWRPRLGEIVWSTLFLRRQ